MSTEYLGNSTILNVDHPRKRWGTSGLLFFCR